MGLKDRILNSAKVQNALEEGWRIHSRMFREIMEPAFVGDDAARLELVAALNLISRGESAKGLKKLSDMKKYCRCDADNLAVLFFMGLACERAGDDDNAMLFFSAAAEYEPDFYLLYHMMAQLQQRKEAYEPAVSNYMATLKCLENEEKLDEIPAVSRKDLLAAIYGNLASCLINIGNYDDAEWALYESEKYVPDQEKQYITWAALYAVTDRAAMAKEKMAQLKEKNPELEAQASFKIAELLAGKNPRFKVQEAELNRAHYDEFWSWFESNADCLYKMLTEDDPDEAVNQIYEALDEVFPFMTVPVEFGIHPDEKFEQIFIDFCDNYIATLTAGLERLIEKAPESLKDKWAFSIIN